MKERHVIKRYPNRKLYDTETSKYVNLEDLSDMIKRGEDFVILDHRSKKDLTAVTLAQVIFEEEKKRKTPLPLSLFQQLIRSGGQTIQKHLSSGIHSIEERFRPVQTLLMTLPQVQKELRELKRRIDRLEKAVLNGKER